jgi:hypothetical protein
MDVKNSGRDVAAASKTIPINIPPRRVRKAITSPYFANCIAANTKIADEIINFNHIIKIKPFLLLRNSFGTDRGQAANTPVFGWLRSPMISSAAF